MQRKKVCSPVHAIISDPQVTSPSLTDMYISPVRSWPSVWNITIDVRYRYQVRLVGTDAFSSFHILLCKAIALSVVAVPSLITVCASVRSRSMKVLEGSRSMKVKISAL